MPERPADRGHHLAGDRTRYLDWELDDPAGKDVADVRPVRDEIEQRVRGLMADLGVARMR